MDITALLVAIPTWVMDLYKHYNSKHVLRKVSIEYCQSKGSLIIKNISDRTIYDLRMTFPENDNSLISMKGIPRKDELNPGVEISIPLFESGYTLEKQTLVVAKYRLKIRGTKIYEDPSIKIGETFDPRHIDSIITTNVNLGRDPRDTKIRKIKNRLNSLDEKYENTDTSTRWWNTESNPREYKNQ